MPDRDTALEALQELPGVGPSIADDLYRLGFRTPKDLQGQDPEAIYRSLMALDNCHVDRCVLYVFRCAVNYATTNEKDPERLKWSNWKDDNEM